jgi:hypothetical protein
VDIFKNSLSERVQGAFDRDLDRARLDEPRVSGKSLSFSTHRRAHQTGPLNHQVLSPVQLCAPLHEARRIRTSVGAERFTFVYLPSHLMSDLTGPAECIVLREARQSSDLRNLGTDYPQFFFTCRLTLFPI